MNQRGLHPGKVAVLADTDSRWKWGMATARELRPASVGAFVKIGPSSPSPRQLAECGVDPAAVQHVSIADFPRALASSDCQVLIAALSGDACQALLHALAGQPTEAPRPLVVTGYVGVVYERLVEGLLLRAGSDIVLANSPHDAQVFRQVYRDFALDPETIVETALPFLSTPGSAGDEEPFTVTFAAQPDQPSARRDRAYVVDRLAQHARLFPEREVLLKVRGLPGERLTHPEPYPYSRLVERLGDGRPANLSLVTGSMDDVLKRTNLLVTVSSTAAVEAMHRGIPTAIVSDFGIRETLGNAYFSGSGCIASFDDLDRGAAPSADPDWTRSRGIGSAVTADAFRERVAALRAEETPPLRPFYSLSRSPAYLPRLLASHGLAPDGSPLVDPLEHKRARRVIRSVSQALYRQGVDVLAPALRRLAS